MIAIDCRFESVILRTQVEVKVYLPNPENFMNPVSDFKARYTFVPFKTAFLLHGMMDSANQWVENTNVVRLAQDAGIALVIPSCGNNFYVNTVYGAKYSDFISKELIGFVRALFPLSDRREDNYLWGISMGGYGALRQAFVNKDLFSKVIAMSPTSDIEFSARFSSAMAVESKYILGDWKKLKGSDLDLYVLAERASAEREELPDLKIIVADKDYFVRTGSEFKEVLDGLKIKNDYAEYPGDHSWRFWDEHTAECIEWLNKGSEGDRS